LCTSDLLHCNYTSSIYTMNSDNVKFYAFSLRQSQRVRPKKDGCTSLVQHAIYTILFFCARKFICCLDHFVHRQRSVVLPVGKNSWLLSLMADTHRRRSQLDNKVKVRKKVYDILYFWLLPAHSLCSSGKCYLLFICSITILSGLME
jgi:hypothetical protein